MVSKEVIMLLDNAFDPDFRVYKEAFCLIELGYDVTIFSWDRECQREINEEIDGIKIKRIRTRSRFQLGIKQLLFLFLFYIKVFPSLLKVKMDVVYSHDLLMLPMGVLIKILRGKKLVYDAHEIYWLMEKKKYNKFILGIIKRLENFLIKFVNSLICVSERRASYYKQYYKKQIYVVGNYYNPIGMSQNQGIKTSEKEELRKELGIPKDKLLITYIGSFHKVRDIKLLVDYALQNQDVFVIIAGKGYWEEYIKEAQRHCSNIIYLGWVSEPIKYYSVSDIIYYVLDDNYEYNHYNAPNNLYISIALKIPIIVNMLGEAGEVVEKYGIGAIIEKRDVESLKKAVDYVCENKEAIMSKFGKAQKIYNWDTCKERFKEAV